MEALEAAETGQEAPQTGGHDLGPLTERIDGLASQMDRLVQGFTPPAQEAAEPDDDDDEFDIASLFDIPDEEPQQQPLDPAALQGVFSQYDQRMQAQIEKALAPLMERQQATDTRLEAEVLAAKYPDLADPAIAGPVVQKAQELAESVGDPSLRNNMQLIELIYKAQMAEKHAAGEQPAGAEQGFALERAGGAGPAASEQPNIAQRIAAQRGADQPWRSW